MLTGTTEDLRRAAQMIAKCEVENERTQGELADMVRRLEELASDMQAAAVRKVVGC